MRLIGQLLSYAAFFALVALFSVAPELRLLDDNEAIVSLSFSHAANRVGECKRLSQEELMALPPNMRKPDECPRERHSLHVEFFVDNELAYETTLAPSGLWNDGKSTVYQRLRIPAGPHLLHIRMNDSGTQQGYDFDDSAMINLSSEQNLVVFFDASEQRFQFR